MNTVQASFLVVVHSMIGAAMVNFANVSGSWPGFPVALAHRLPLHRWGIFLITAAIPAVTAILAHGQLYYSLTAHTNDNLQ